VLDRYRFCEDNTNIDMGTRKQKPPATLQEWMQREGVNGAELARRAKISQSLLSMILSGSRRCSLKNAVTLNAVTGVPAENIAQWPKVPIKRSFLEVA
jgi:transcriptional regulator with XRE-family HTH domain